MTPNTLQRNGANGHTKRLPRGVLLGPDGEPFIVTNRMETAPGLFFGGGGSGYGQYGANVTKNSLAGWLWRGGDADADIGLNIQILRERSRDAFMGVPLAAGAIECLDTNVVGEGLSPAPAVDGQALGLSPEETTALRKEIAEKWEWWASNPRECDYEQKHSFYVLQSTAFQSALLSGDCPVLFPLKPRPGCVFDLRLRVLEADRIRDPIMIDPRVNIFTGIELAPDGELLAYHISARHPLSIIPRFFNVQDTYQTFRIEPFGPLSGRRNIAFIIRPERPEQRRGVPILAVCLELLKQLSRYIDSTVLGAVIQSYFTAFITSDFPDPTTFQDLLTDDQKVEILNFNPYNVQLGPGIVNFMRPGHAVNFASPTQPQATFGDFTIACAKFVGAATGVPYEVILKQYNSSYSASRAALLDFWKRVRKWRGILIDCLCQPAYEEWMADAIALNQFKLFKGNFDDPYVRRAMTRCIWTGASAGTLDPVKEVAASDQKVRCGFSTIERESAELNGSNYRDNISQQSIEQQEFTEADLIFPPNRPLAGQGSGLTAAPAPTPGAPAPTPTPSAPPKARGSQRMVLASGLSGRFER